MVTWPDHIKEMQIDSRRQFIAKLMVRNPWISVRQIRVQLAAQQFQDPITNQVIRPGINPDTGEMWSIGTIYRDIRAIKEEAKAKIGQEAKQWLAEVVAETQEVKARAWRDGDIRTILQANRDLKNLLGLGPDQFDAERVDRITVIDFSPPPDDVVEGADSQ